MESDPRPLFPLFALCAQVYLSPCYAFRAGKSKDRGGTDTCCGMEKKKSQVFWQRYGKDGLVVKRALIAKTGKRKDLVIIPVVVSLLLCSDRRPGFPSSRVYQRRTMFETMFVPTAGDTVNKLLFCSRV